MVETNIQKSATNSEKAQRVVVTVCTYNELENLPRLIKEIHGMAPTVDVLVVDDDSPDGTGKLADQLAAEDSRIHILHRIGERGLGTATIKAFQHALDAGYDLLINMDADFSHPPRYLPDLIEKLGATQADVVIGSRYVLGGKIVGWSWKRHLMSQGVNIWSRLCLGLKARDCSGSYRCYRCSMLRKIDFNIFRSQGYSVQEELLFRAIGVNAKIEESPIIFEDRIVGESKINWKEAIRAIFVILQCGFERFSKKKPPVT